MQSVAIRMSISSVRPGISTSRPFARGEKQVRIVLRSARRRGAVVRPSIVPVISAVSSPSRAFAASAMLA